MDRMNAITTNGHLTGSTNFRGAPALMLWRGHALELLAPLNPLWICTSSYAVREVVTAFISELTRSVTRVVKFRSGSRDYLPGPTPCTKGTRNCIEGKWHTSRNGVAGSKEIPCLRNICGAFFGKNGRLESSHVDLSMSAFVDDRGFPGRSRLVREAAQV